MTIDEISEIALSFPGTEDAPHFDRIAFRITGKRIFATMHVPSRTVNIKLSKVDQNLFCSYAEDAVYPVPNKWGLQGWTTFDLVKVSRELMLAALDQGYQTARNK